MENMSGAANGVFILPKPSPGSAKKMPVLGDKNGRLSSGKKYGKTPPLKPPKKHRSPDDDTEILRCKRRIQFAGRMGLPVQQRNPKQMAKRNERERNRVQTINSTFETLQAYLPPSYIQPKPKNKKMSKVEVLHAAINYIRNLQEVLSESEHMAVIHPHPGHHHHPGHLLPHQQQQQQQLMMVASTASTPGMETLQPVHIYPSPQTPSVMSNPNQYYAETPSYHPAHSPLMAATAAHPSQQQQQQQVLTVETCSPTPSFSPNSAHSDPFDGPQQQPSTGPTGPYSMTGGNVPTAASPSYGEAPLTPEDEDIIMEWLHDQKS